MFSRRITSYERICPLRLGCLNETANEPTETFLFVIAQANGSLFLFSHLYYRYNSIKGARLIAKNHNILWTLMVADSCVPRQHVAANWIDAPCANSFYTRTRVPRRTRKGKGNVDKKLSLLVKVDTGKAWLINLEGNDNAHSVTGCLPISRTLLVV